MKKFSMFLVLIMLLVFPAGYSFADSDSVSIIFKVGDDTLKINGKDTKVEKPYVVNGVTLVPLRVITEAFGAEVKWNDKDSSITIKYGEKTIKLFVGSNKVLVDEQESTILQAPNVINGVTMVPLRFITENFGSDIKYDSDSKQITVTKEIAGNNSIKDYSLILKKTAKTKVGDSYYNWTMNFPKGLKIADRSFDGTYTHFVNDDGSLHILIEISVKTDETYDSLLSESLSKVKDYTLISQGKESKDGVTYTKAVFKGDKVFDLRNFIKGDKIFSVLLSANDYDKYKDSNEYTSIIDSFTTDYKGSTLVEDLSDINKDGYRTFSEKKLKFSLDVLPEWYQHNNEKQPNKVEFYDGSNPNDEFEDSLSINMYSIKDGDTLDSCVNKQLKDMSDYVNPEYYKILKQEDGELNGIKCKKIYYTEKVRGVDTYSCDVYLLGNKYKYNVFYHIKQDTADNKDKFNKIERALNSFKFTEPDEKKVGTLLDQNDITESTNIVTKRNSTYKWSVNLPASWVAQSSNNDKDKVRYGNNALAFSLFVGKGDNLEDFITVVDQEYDKDVKTGNKKIIKKEKVNVKGSDGYYYSTVNTIDKLDINTDTYILCKNGYIYIVDLMCPAPSYTEKNKNIIKTIWDSLSLD